MATQEVLVRLRAVGARAFQRDMDTSAQSVTDVGKASESTGKQTAKSFAKWAGGTAAVAAGTKALKDGVKGAIDLGEQINKTAVVFRGPGAKSVLDWSKGSAKAMGVSRAEALEAAGTFGNMLVPMGFARTQAADMSKNMIQLGSDMASFNNASPEETLDAIRSGLAGETEPLRRFGVFLSEGRIKAQAMSMGLVKATKDTDKIRQAQTAAGLAQRKYNNAVGEHGGKSMQAKQALLALRKAQGAVNKATAGSIPTLTAAQKAQATYGLIMSDTKDAQGDFTRTSDSLANRQRVLSAQYKDITATVGTQLLPILTLMANNLPIVAVAVGVMTTALIAYKVAAIAATIAGGTFNVTLFAIPIAIAAVVAALVIAYQKVGWFRSAVQATFAWIKSHWPLLVTIIGGPLGVALVQVIKHFDKVKAAAQAVFDLIKNVIAKVGELASKIANSPVGKVIAKAGDVLPFQHGGVMPHAGTALVGEAGPELLSLPGGARITPSISPGHTTAHFYLDRRLIASAVAQADADQRARR